MKYYLVSSCLLGVKSRYDGTDVLKPSLARSLKNKPVLLICPEKLGGLKTPRLPAQIVPRDKGRKAGRIDVLSGQARVCNQQTDVTAQFIKGARRVMGIIKQGKIGITGAYLKARSPSCGYGKVYIRTSGTAKAKLAEGDGVLAALLKQHHIRISSV